jgi:NTP pyrophosphatase (non-canonical NTP hydrolase)
VEYLADRMEETLRRNDTKPAWELQTGHEVLDKFYEELMEFLDAIPTGKAEDIEAEGIDVIIMIGATMAKFVPIMGKWRRGREE